MAFDPLSSGTWRDITLVSGGVELLGDIAPLWEELNEHHASVSPHFGDFFASMTFARRRPLLEEKSARGSLRVDLASFNGEYIGYCIASVDQKVGEIESIYVAKSQRNRRVGDVLMQRAMKWMDKMDVEKRIIGVAVGNERAYGFYERFGFYPRVIILQDK